MNTVYLLSTKETSQGVAQALLLITQGRGTDYTASSGVSRKIKDDSAYDECLNGGWGGEKEKKLSVS